MSAYVIEKKESKKLTYLPQRGQLRSGHQVEFDYYRESDVEELYSIFNKILEDGQTYPQEVMKSVTEFRAYYLSHDAFVLREVTSGQVVGAFYVKPNYPGRSGHICNAGFIVQSEWQGRGVATFLVPWFLEVAPDLGYSASIFNLVYVTNSASIRLWRKFGFEEVGRIPKAGHLRGLGPTDAIVFHYDFSRKRESGLSGV